MFGKYVAKLNIVIPKLQICSIILENKRLELSTLMILPA